MVPQSAFKIEEREKKRDIDELLDFVISLKKVTFRRDSVWFHWLQCIKQTKKKQTRLVIFECAEGMEMRPVLVVTCLFLVTPITGSFWWVTYFVLCLLCSSMLLLLSTYDMFTTFLQIYIRYVKLKLNLIMEWNKSKWVKSSL